jgi:hypothetical protein
MFRASIRDDEGLAFLYLNGSAFAHQNIAVHDGFALQPGRLSFHESEFYALLGASVLSKCIFSHNCIVKRQRQASSDSVQTWALGRRDLYDVVYVFLSETVERDKLLY